MSDISLAGVGVLVTRPSHQAAELSAAIEAAGGHTILFPAIEIAPRSPQDVEAEVAGLVGLRRS